MLYDALLLYEDVSGFVFLEAHVIDHLCYGLIHLTFIVINEYFL